jgi:hypothetical protein
MDIDGLERAGLMFARRVFQQRGEPRSVTLDEHTLGQMLAFAHQIGASMQSRTTIAGPDSPCHFTGVARNG